MFYTTVQVTLDWVMLNFISLSVVPKLFSRQYKVNNWFKMMDQMPFNVAFIYKVYRMASVAPISVYRGPCKDITIGGLLVLDSLVVFHLWG